MSRESVTAMGRAFFERGMTAAVKIGTGVDKTQPDLSVEFEFTSTHYEGIAEVIPPANSPSEAVAGGQAIAKQEGLLKLPVATSGNVATDDVIVVLSNDLDPSLIGKRFRVAGEHGGTYTVNRRLRITRET